MRNLVPIGRFSKVTGLTVKALRLYDEMGLLRPAAVDADSGYRYYSLAQAAEAERIRLLRDLEVPLEDIRAILAAREPAAALALLERHRRRVDQQIAGHRRTLAALQRLIVEGGAAMAYEVRVKQVEAQPVVSVRTRTPLAQIGQVMGGAFGELYALLGETGARPAGAPFALYHDPEFKEEDVDVEIGVPAAEPVEGRGRVAAGILPGGPVAYTLHAGPYDEIGRAYQALAAWIQEHGHETAGPPREVYLVGPAQTRDEAEYRTEIDWPIR